MNEYLQLANKNLELGQLLCLNTRFVLKKCNKTVLNTRSLLAHATTVILVCFYLRKTQIMTAK